MQEASAEYNWDLNYGEIASAVNYYDGYRTARLPANLLQAQFAAAQNALNEGVKQKGNFSSNP